MGASGGGDSEWCLLGLCGLSQPLPVGLEQSCADHALSLDWALPLPPSHTCSPQESSTKTPPAAPVGFPGGFLAARVREHQWLLGAIPWEGKHTANPESWNPPTELKGEQLQLQEGPEWAPEVAPACCQLRGDAQESARLCLRLRHPKPPSPSYRSKLRHGGQGIHQAARRTPMD